jgi:hypothetical protein
MAYTDQQQIRQPRQAQGLLAETLLPTGLRLAHPKIGRPRVLELCPRSPSLIRAHHLARRKLVQIGPQGFRRLRANILPFFAEDHGAVASRTQTPARAISPAGHRALGRRAVGKARPLVLCGRPRCHPIFNRLALDGFQGRAMAQTTPQRR